MVRNNGRHTTSTTAAKIAADHRESDDRNTVGFFDEDDLRAKYLSPSKIGLWSPRTYGQKGALVGWFELSGSTRGPLLPRQSRHRVYHPDPELIVGDLPSRVIFRMVPNVDWCDPVITSSYCSETWEDYFRGGSWTGLSADRFPRSNWNDFNNQYYLQPDFAPASAEERDPESVHDQQAGLGAYTDPEPCAYGELSDCHCCLCPDCGSVATRRRKNKEPEFACGNPSCSTDGIDKIDVRPARRGD